MNASFYLPYDAFVSHNSADKQWTSGLVRNLESRGLRIWFDADQIGPGENIITRVQEGLESSACVILVLSPEALQSDFVALEYSAGRMSDPAGRRHGIIPLIRRKCTIPLAMRPFQYLDFTDDTLFEERLNDLTRGVIGAIKLHPSQSAPWIKQYSAPYWDAAAHTTFAKGDESVQFGTIAGFLKIVRWRDGTEGMLPFERRTVGMGDALFEVDIYDEAICYMHRTLAHAYGDQCNIDFRSSGIFELNLLEPTKGDLDLHEYRGTNGSFSRCVFSLQEMQDLFYTWHFYNGFQKGQEDFALAVYSSSADRLHLTIDFTSVLHDVNFRKVPQAFHYRIGGPIPGTPIHANRLEDSGIWSAYIENPGHQSKLIFSWALANKLGQAESGS